MGRVLVIGSDEGLATTLRESAALRGHTVDACTSALEALKEARLGPLDLVVTDAATQVQEDMAMVAELNRLRPGVRTILLAPALTDSDVVTALRAQVFACFTAPVDPRDVADMAATGLKTQSPNRRPGHARPGCRRRGPLPTRGDKRSSGQYSRRSGSRWR